MKAGRLVLCAALVVAAGRTHGSAPTPAGTGLSAPMTAGGDPRVGPIQDAYTTRTIQLTLTEGTAMAAAASPDGRWIAIDLLGSLWVLPSRGGEARKITPDLLEARQPTWSPDSEWIAFQGYDDEAWHIYVIAREGGEPKAITSGPFDDREPDWSHDGRLIAFSSDRAGGISTIWQVAPANGTIGQVSLRDGWMPCWSPGDREVVFVSADLGPGGIPTRASVPGLYAHTQGEDRLVLPAKDMPMPAAPACARVTSPIAYASPSGLYVSGQPVTKREDVFPFRPQWLRRDEILYTADGRIKRRSTFTDSVVDIPFKATVTLQRSTYTIAHRLLETTAPQRVGGIVSPAVAPDGRSIAFVAMSDVWILPLGGVPIRVTDDPFVELDPSWSPDGTEIAFASDRGGQMDLWIHNLKTSEDTKLTKDGGVSGAAWSPDGAHIAYRVDGRGVAIVNLRRDQHAFGVTRRDTGGEIGRPTWAADHSAIAFGALFPYSNRFREGMNQLLLQRLDTGGLFSSLLFPDHSAGDRQHNGPVWAPDGFHMAFVSEGRLWSVAVDASGAATSLPLEIGAPLRGEDRPEAPSWEKDSRHVVYLTPAGFRRVPADGGPGDRIPIQMAWKGAAPPARVVVHAGHVFDGVLEALHDESDIVIENGIISEVAGHRPELHAGAAVVQADRETVMPGLVEMHAHLSREYGERFGRIWLAYGITSLRIPAINAYEGLELRESFDAGRRPGPRVFSAGDPFDGARIYYPGGVSIESDEQLDRELERATTLGFDFFKTYVRLPDRFQKRVVEYAHARGLPVTSHELYPAIAFGIDGVEHLAGTSRRGYSPKVSATNIAYKDVIDLLAKSGVTLTPTIGILGGFLARATGDRALLTDERLALFPKSVVLMLADLASQRPDPRLDALVKPYETMLKSIVTAGGTIVAGTDAPIVPYGLSLHVELEEYVRSGMTPFQALQTATVNAARALGLDEELGTIEPGKRADLTFVGDDPLRDIRNARDVRRVMKGGRVYTLKELITPDRKDR